MWAFTCGVGVLASMSPRPVLLGGLIGALSAAYWLASDIFSLAEPTDWQISGELVNRPRGGDARVVTLEHVITDSRTLAESRVRLHQILSALADDRLLSLRGIDRHADPAGARAALGPELDDFISNPEPDRAAIPAAWMSLLLNRIESL